MCRRLTSIALAVRDRTVTAHEVVTAHEMTRVTFTDLAPEEIAAYVATDSPRDKAGAYGIQDDLGSVFVSGIAGDYFTVVGLPLHRLYRTLRAEFGAVVAVSVSERSSAANGASKSAAVCAEARGTSVRKRARKARGLKTGTGCGMGVGEVASESRGEISRWSAGSR